MSTASRSQSTTEFTVELHDLLEVYKRCPREALGIVLKKGEESLYQKALILTFTTGLDGRSYSGCRHLNRKDLEGRRYTIMFTDFGVTLHFTDVLHNPTTFRNEPKVNQYAQFIQYVKSTMRRRYGY